MLATVLLLNVAQTVASVALQILVPVVTAFLLWVVHRVVAVVEAKAGVQVPADTQAMLDSWVQKAIAYAEQKAANAVQANLATVTGPQKLEMAVQFVLDLAQQYGLVSLAKDKIEALVEAHLGMQK